MPCVAFEHPRVISAVPIMHQVGLMQGVHASTILVDPFAIFDRTGFQVPSLLTRVCFLRKQSLR